MNKTQLENLIKRMNTPFEPEIKVSREMESWKARRESHGIKSKADLDKQTDEEGAALYEDLKAGILEEYDITYKKLVSLLNKLVK